MRYALIAPLLAGLATAVPSKLARRADEFCGQWDSVTEGDYIVYNNLWGQDNADSGSQCTTVTGLSGDQLGWSTSWSWSGGSSNVKSYANAVLNFDAAPVSSFSTIPTSWSWSYTGSNIVANVAYDLFTSSTADGSEEFEVMIWLNALGGAGPISSTGSTVDTPNVGGVSWDLYSGTNGQMQVYSFVAQSSQENFSGDLVDFLSYLQNSQGFSSSQYLKSIGAGTEPFTGSNAVFTTTAYSVSVS